MVVSGGQPTVVDVNHGGSPTIQQWHTVVVRLNFQRLAVLRRFTVVAFRTWRWPTELRRWQPSIIKWY